MKNTIMETEKYIINTGEIFQDLKENWENFDRDFLSETVHIAFKSILLSKKVTSVSFDGSNGDYLKRYSDGQYFDDLIFCNTNDCFPFPDYFLANDDKNKEFRKIVLFQSDCIATKDDDYFDLFFALKLYFLDKMKLDIFLKYHLTASFNKNKEIYFDFIKKLCFKYKNILESDFQSFILDFINKNNDSNLNVESNNIDKTEPGEFTTVRRVLAMLYIFEELGVHQTDKTELARFIEFLSKEEKSENIINTNIYKKIKRPFSLNNKIVIDDLTFIRGYFEKLNLESIVNKINKEIGSK